MKWRLQSNLSPHIGTFCVCVRWQCLGFILSKFKVQYSVINYCHQEVHWIFRTNSSYNWSFVPTDHHFPHFLNRPAPGNHQSTLCFWEFGFKKKSSITKIIKYLSLSDLFHYHKTLKFHWCYCKWLDFLLFSSWIIFHVYICISIPPLVGTVIVRVGP